MQIGITCSSCGSELTITAPDKDLKEYLKNKSEQELDQERDVLAAISIELAKYYSSIEVTKPSIYLISEPEPSAMGITDRFYEWAFVTERFYNDKITDCSILDVGSANTALPSILASMGNRVTSVDIQRWQITWPGVTALQLDLLKDEFPDTKKFDYAICISAIEHFGLGRYNDTRSPDGDFEGMKVIRAALKPRGKLIMSFPVGKPAIVFPAHRVYGPKRAEKLMEDFKINDKRFFINHEGIPFARFECSEKEAFETETYLGNNPYYSLGCYFLEKR